MRCFHCKKEIENDLDMKIIGIDGDVVCDQDCKEAFEKERERFFNEVIHSEQAFFDWMVE